jgi:hypothetical protein
MSNQQNKELKFKILDEITSMTVDEFQTLCERHNIENNVVAEIDIAIGELVEIEFEDRNG